MAAYGGTRRRVLAGPRLRWAAVDAPVAGQKCWTSRTRTSPGGAGRRGDRGAVGPGSPRPVGPATRLHPASPGPGPVARGVVRTRRGTATCPMDGRRSRRSISTSRRVPGSARTTGGPSCRPGTGGNISGPAGSRFAGAGGSRGVRLRTGQDTVAVAGRANSAPARLSERPHRFGSQRVKRRRVWLALTGPARRPTESGRQALPGMVRAAGRTRSSCATTPTRTSSNHPRAGGERADTRHRVRGAQSSPPLRYVVLEPDRIA